MADEDTQVVEGGAPQAPDVSGANDSEQQLRAELAQTRGQLQQVAAAQIQQYIQGLPEPQREAAAREIAYRLREQQLQAKHFDAQRAEERVNEEAKRVLIARLAADHSLDANWFAQRTKSMTDPEDMIALAKDIGEQRKATLGREAPAATGVRPDSGGAGGGQTREEIVRDFQQRAMTTGSSQVKNMRQALRDAGFDPA